MERQSLLAAPIFCRSLARVPAAKGLLGLLPPSLASLSNEDDVDTMHRFRLWPAFTVVYHTSSSSSSLLVCVCVYVFSSASWSVSLFFSIDMKTPHENQDKMKSLFTPFTEGRGDVQHPQDLETLNLENLMWIPCAYPNQRVHTRDHNKHYKGHKKRINNFPAKHFPPETRGPPCSSVRAFCGDTISSRERAQ